MTATVPAPTEPEIREALAEVYRPEGVEIWLHAGNKLLDGAVPADLIARGDGAMVLDVIEMLATGAVT